jgi:two-component system LytT family response regulator
MRSIEKRIGPPLIRVHRSAIVNLDFIVEIRMKPSGKCSVLMQDGTELLLSRTYRKELSWLFEGVL